MPPPCTALPGCDGSAILALPERGERVMLTHPVYRAWRSVAGAVHPARPFLVRETTPVTPPKPRLLDRVRAALQARHYSRRTEEAYVAWIKRYIFFFHAQRHPAEMGAPEVTRFLSSLAVDGRVPAYTQNQAVSTTMIYTHVLNRGPAAVRSPADRMLTP
jgi:Phage integrase, N-terminal SAM-like domain